MKNRYYFLGVIAVVSIVVFFLRMPAFSDQDFTSDLEALSEIDTDFGKMSEFFTNIANDKSAVYAYELLKKVDFKPNIDQHLVGHVVGDELYKQEGLQGMKYCTDDFRNACSHTIVIGSLLENGLSVFDEVNDVCHQAPGGIGAYTMCFHGFGHGVLAYTEYDMEKTVDLCERVGTKQYNYQESSECIGGAVMEMKDGIHDAELWAGKKDLYVDPDNPLSLCQLDYMPDRAKPHCYSYITPYLFDSAGAEGALPTPEIFKDSFSYCEKEPNLEYRLLCYKGFGKEFIVLAVDYDITQLDNIADEKLQTIIDWCNMINDDLGSKECKLDVVNSLYWGGENDYVSSVRYCSLFTDQDKSLCFDQIFENVNFYEKNPNKRKQICESVPENFLALCQQKLL